MLYVISVLLAAITVILILINTKLKLFLEWVRGLHAECESGVKGIWTVSRTISLLLGQIDKSG